MLDALERLYAGLRSTDEAVAKAAGLSELARMARTEQRLREYLLARWNKRLREAVKVASAMARKLEPPSKIAAAVRKIMKPWAKEVGLRIADETERVYYLARIAGWKKGTKQTRAGLGYSTPSFTEVRKAAPALDLGVMPAFDVVDEDVVEALRRHQLFWIGEHYEKNLSGAIARTTKETMVEAGRNQVVAGKLMSERIRDELSHVRTPKGFHGTAEQYFEGLTANAATVARAHGQMSSFMRLGYTRYIWNSTGDRRVCPVCAHMDGKTFTVRQGAETMFNELQAESPDEVKSAHPWVSEAQLKEISPKAGPVGRADAEALSKAGVNIPPGHFR